MAITIVSFCISKILLIIFNLRYSVHRKLFGVVVSKESAAPHYSQYCIPSTLKSTEFLMNDC